MFPISKRGSLLLEVLQNLPAFPFTKGKFEAEDGYETIVQ
jgi:hypothetical protein